MARKDGREAMKRQMIAGSNATLKNKTKQKNHKKTLNIFQFLFRNKPHIASVFAISPRSTY